MISDPPLCSRTVQGCFPSSAELRALRSRLAVGSSEAIRFKAWTPTFLWCFHRACDSSIRAPSFLISAEYDWARGWHLA